MAYGLPHAAFFNLSSPGDNNAVDWAMAYLGEVFIDQKATALLAMLFGTGLVLFGDRAAAAGQTTRRSTLWRSFCLFWIGVPVGMHGLLWEGTSLFFLAFFSPLPILLRNRPARLLLLVGSGFVGFSALLGPWMQSAMPDDISLLGQYWITGAHGTDDETGALMFIPLEIFFRLLGAMLIGTGMARLGVFQGERPPAFYRRMAVYGLGAGIPLAVASVVWREVGDYRLDVAFAGEAPNTLAAIPMALGYVGLVTLWTNRALAPALLDRVGAVGRMALTNSVLQTAIGIGVLREGFIGRGTLSRTGLVGIVVAVWAVQLVGSKLWLERLRFGPVELLVRQATYRRRLSHRD